jgi:hypothetical protein
VRQTETTLLYPRSHYAAELLFVDDFADPRPAKFVDSCPAHVTLKPRPRRLD